MVGFLDGSGVSKVQILIDGKAVGTAQYGLSRPDVAKVYPQYKNSNSGYQYTLDTGKFTNGKHSINVQEIGKNGKTTKTYTQTINMQNLPAKGSIDSPSNGSSVYGIITVSGWFLDGSGVSKIQVLADGKVVGTAQYGLSRPDVAKTYSQYKNSNSGYQYALNTTKLTNGKHTLSIKENGRNGVTSTLTKNIIVNQDVLNALAEKIKPFEAKYGYDVQNGWTDPSVQRVGIYDSSNNYIGTVFDGVINFMDPKALTAQAEVAVYLGLPASVSKS